MKKHIVLLILIALLCFVCFGEPIIDIPGNLNEHEAEIYRQGYMAGYYAAQHGAIDERHPENDDGHYIVNIKSKLFHYPSCNGVQSMNERNKMDFYGTREEAIEAGYSPCGMCDP